MIRFDRVLEREPSPQTIDKVSLVARFNAPHLALPKLCRRTHIANGEGLYLVSQ